MIPQLHLILLVLSFVCFALSAWQYAAPFWGRLISVGFAALVLSMIVL